ncbi:MAG: DUF2062 domain-containing protein [Candidatus Omnitrophota bacterium]
MDKRPLTARILRYFRWLYLKIFRINDTPQKIAAGFGIGVLLGVMPGTGPFAALFLAILLKVNRAAALLSSILTNTWLSIPVFFLAVKTGSAVTGIGYGDISDSWSLFLKDFTWGKLLQLSVYDIIAPVVIGYILVSLCMGIIAYFVVLAITERRRKA